MHRDSGGPRAADAPSGCFVRGRARVLGRRLSIRTTPRLPQRAGDRDRPTGTIGFMMIVIPPASNRTWRCEVQEAGGRRRHQDRQQHRAAGADQARLFVRQAEKIVSHIDSTGTIEGAPDLKPEHLAVFDCSFRPQNGARSIHYMGHVRMMAAVAAVHLRRHFEDHQHARGIHGGRHRQCLHRKLEAGAESGSDLPRQFQARAAAQLGQRKTEKKGRDCVPCRPAPVEKVVYRPVRASCPTSGGASPTSFRSAATRATSQPHVRRWLGRPNSSSPWPRKARPFPA